VLVAAGTGAALKIGNHVGISGAVIWCSERIVIEDYVNLGAGSMVYDTDFHPVEYLARRNSHPGKTKTAPVHIERDVFIGARAIILKGVRIGERSIVGAGSVVVKDVPNDCIVCGVPAKIVRKLPPPQ